MGFVSTEALYTAFYKCQGIEIDSRQVNSGDLFFALQGEQADGNKYAKAAIEAGASFAVVDNPAFAHDQRYLLVQDTLVALQDLANYHRRQFSIPIIAITGSNGKTTTKELLAVVLSKAYECHATKGNFNNHIGVPLTLLRMPKSTEVAVIEMGANHPGEIAALCQIAEPTHGIITNIGKAHLEGFGGLEGVKKTKAELYDFLSVHDGVAFLNKDELYLNDLSSALAHRRVFYGKLETEEENKWLRGSCISGVDGKKELTFWDDQDQEVLVKSQLVGDYNCPNLITASSLGLYFKVPSTAIKEALENYIPRQNRSQIIKAKKTTYILDAYNANPSSMEAALQNLNQQEAPYKIAILGAMKELGTYAEAEHQRILTLAKSYQLDRLIAIGEEFSAAAAHLQISYYPRVEDYITNNPQINKEALVLIKGSRSISLEKIVEGLA